MFKYNLLLSLLGLFTTISSSYSQGNLLVNPDFEDYITCPDWPNQFNRCYGWTTPTLGSSDYYNACSSSPFVTVPSNNFGSLAAYNGVGYAGIYFYQPLQDPNLSYVEYIQGQTSSPLEAGKTYKLSMKVSLSNHSSIAIDEFGAYFSSNPFFDSIPIQLEFTPQCVFQNPNFYTSVGSWMHAEATFIAQGGEQYLTISIFKKAVIPNTLSVNPDLIAAVTYMFIDGIKLVDIEHEEEEEEPQIPETFLIPNIFTPNGDGTNDLWKPQLAGFETYTVSILNRWGNLIYESSADGFSWNGQTSDGKSYSDGVYFYRINGTNMAGSFELIR